MEHMQDFRGQTAFITGASSGLGLHFAEILARCGCAVMLAARRTELLDEHVKRLRGEGLAAEAIGLDVRDTAAIGPALDEAEKRLGPLSILINNAGISPGKPALQVEPAEWDQVLEVNSRGVFFGSTEAARRMIENGVAASGDARIVNVSSITASMVTPGLAAYSASKAAVSSLTKILAREWARPGISVNALCPGYIETDLNTEWFASEAGVAQIRSWPRRRMIPIDTLDDIFLAICGKPGRYITGSLFYIDDGQSL
jgi:NAD(P)-dependent dehydrogenase (short-subunit alcohol dehydrogenase family)